MGFYDRHIVPVLINAACAAKPFRYQRAKIVPQAAGRVLEVGAGSGHNIAFFDSAKVESLTCVEPSEALLKKAREAAKAAPFPVSHLHAGVENMQIEEASVDTVLLTYTLCTIPDAPGALRAIRRALKPGGALLFCEHGHAPDEGVANWQDRINPVWRAIAGGCNLNRRIPALIEEAGFKIDKVETMYLPSTPKVFGYNYWGAARPA